MQANSITLSVDALNNGTPANQVYTRSEEVANRSTYRGPLHTLQSKDTLQFYRTLPKRQGNFLGAAKCSVKLTQDVSVPNADGSGEIVVPMIIETAFSFPVGVTDAQMLAIRQRMVAVLDTDSVVGALNSYLEI